jgi:cell division protein FtsW
MKRAAAVESRVLVLVTLGLVAFGLVMVYSATSARSALANADPMSYLKKQAAYAAIGVVLMMLAARFDYRRLRALAPTLVLTALFLCLAVLAIGTRVNGARRWMTFGPATFQPSELAKLVLAVWVASYLARRPPPRTLADLWRPIGMLVGVFCVLVLAEPDLGTVIVMVIVVGAVLLISGTPTRTFAAGSGILATLALAAIMYAPYRRARFFSFLHPWHDSQGAGYQIVQGMISLASGGVFGVGLGNGVGKINYLPEAHTDMILAVIGEELGLIGVTAVIAAFVAFAWAGLRVALRCKDPFGSRLATALVALVCGQAAINLAAVLGMAPLTGIPLPFVSYGGSSLVVALASVGILLNIGGRHAGTARASVPDRSRRNRRPRTAVAGGR